MQTLTVFTPAYNRAHTIGRTYKSLCSQKCKDFVWLIVDDGSTDNTAELVKDWMSKDNGFEIQYIYKENGGMHTAHNVAYRNIHTELNTCIDSDDALSENAVEKIINKWNQVKGKGYAGIIALDANMNTGKVIGKGFPKDMTETTLSGYYASGGSGDKKLIYRTDIINSVPEYPVFDDEKYLALAYKYKLIDQKYKLAVLNEIVCDVEYQEDGNSHIMYKQYMKCPKSFAFWRKICMQYPDSNKRLLVDCVHYVADSIIAKNKHYIKESPRKMLTVLATPPGLLLSLFFRMKTDSLMEVKQIIMTKVLFLIPNLAHGGAEKVLVNLANNMDKTKFDVTVQTLFDVGVNRQYLNSDVKYIGGFKRMPRGNTYVMKLFSPEKLYKHFIRDNYDIIVSYLEGPTARIVSGCNNPNTKLVSWIHIEQHTKELASKSFRSYKEALDCYSKFDRTVCVSDTVKDDFESIFDTKKPVEVLYNTNESEKIKKLSDEKVNDVDFSKDIINIISVAKIVPSKGYDRLMKIHKKLIEKNIKNHIYILGIGEEKEKYEKYLAENNLTDTFTFLGYRDNPYKYVKKADLYVCSSRREGFSTAVTEALIVGTPVVSTNCSGAYELLGKNNEYGIVTENDEDALYEGIKKMLTTPDLLEAYAAKAKERGKAFSTEKTVKAVEEMLLSI